jgi:formate dehydrogenase subunit beta
MMNVNRILEVNNGDPVNTFQEFLAALWEQNEFEGLLAPVESPDQTGVAAQLLENVEALPRINPFAPVMRSNAARLTSQIVLEHPARKILAILRPCELRAFIEIQKRARITLEPHSVVILGVDCIGTFPGNEYCQNVDKYGAREVTRASLKNASEGGLRPQRFRTACQVCDWPAPCGADVTIGAIGVATDQHLLVIARNEAVDDRLGLKSVTSALATEYQVSHRETVVGAIADMRSGVRKKLVEDMHSSQRFNDFASFLAWFANCSLCGECLSACPLYNGEFSGLLGLRNGRNKEVAPLAELVAMSRWLASCAGCGMCEETCKCEVPLTLLISALSHRVRGELHYRCSDPAQPLPWNNR